MLDGIYSLSTAVTKNLLTSQFENKEVVNLFVRNYFKVVPLNLSHHNSHMMQLSVIF
jgi:hypothetical protein